MNQSITPSPSTLQTSLQPYPAYKETGIPWLGRIPAHWDVRRGKTLFRKMERPVHPQDEVVTCFRDGTVTLRKNRRTQGFTESLKEIGYQGIRKGDLVIHAMDAFAGAIGVADSDGKGSPVYSVCHPLGGADAHYYAYLLREMARSQWIVALAKGIRERSTDFRYSMFGVQPLPLPPLAEQRAIARYLDWADARIRRLIRARQRQIQLLEEYKQALIHQVVTGQMDVRTGQPYPAYKDSGVEWVGKVPAHWEVTPLKHLGTVQTGITLGKDYRGVPTNAYPYLRVANVQHGKLDLAEIKSINVPAAEAAGALLRPGDVLMTEGGDIDKLGRGCIWNGEIENCLHQNHIFAVRCRTDRLLPEFLVGLMMSGHGRTYFQVTAKKTTNLASTNSTTLRLFPILLPPIAEQHEILQWLGEETTKIDATVAAARRSIDLLREYRTCLIADVVTGKVDVRGAAARLPEETEALSPEEALELDADEEPEEALEEDEVLEG